ncbi:hypothetical protein EG68_12108, partial [Paragonimus skrjabini miyazakii]
PASELLFDGGHPEGLVCLQAAVGTCLFHAFIELVDADIDGVQPSASSSISEELRQVLLKTGAPLSWQHAVTDVVRKYHPEVPNDPRTILRTPRSSAQKPVGGGVYIHLGLETALCSLLKRELVDMIELQLHIDGLSPFKRSAMQLWPVLGRCLSLTNKQPFVIGIYCGPCKPTNEFVRDFSQIYGAGEIVPNVHALTHLADDVQRFGPLDLFSAFPFESFLGRLSRRLHGPTNPAAQIHRRLSELSACSNDFNELKHAVDDTSTPYPVKPKITGNSFYWKKLFTPIPYQITL